MSKFLKRRMSWGSTRSASSTGSRPPVPESEFTLTLDGNTLAMDGKGTWKLGKSTVGNFEAEIERLQRYVRQLEQDKRILSERCNQANGERRMLEFKNEMLLELLAVSQLDAKRNNEEYQREALRTEALKWELGKWTIQTN
mmetsp:Transcript_11695/g.19041  ORF Transcript_11695/g.19041 Transcript_11695/m.19041 type:complete len:141 (+) Transcript_11695:278-700(+)